MHLREAAGLRPDAHEVVDALQELATLRVSAEQFLAAESLASASKLLEARQAYLLVAPEDHVRYRLAMDRADAIERDWVDQAERLVVRRIEDRDLAAISQAVARAQRSLPESELLHASIVRLAEEIASLADEIARERLDGGDVGAAELALRTVEPAIPADALTAVSRIELARAAIELERERRDRQRQEEALARQRLGLPSPTAPRPVVPPAVGAPGTVVGPGGRDCPSPVVDVEAWRTCVFGSDAPTGPAVPGPNLPATVPGPGGRECPSPAVDVEGWRECAFGGGSGILPTPPSSSGPVAPVIPDSSGRDAARDAARREALILELRGREERVLLDYQRLFAAENAATIEYQRRIRDFDFEIQRLVDAGESGSAVIEMRRKQDYIRDQQDSRRRLRALIEAAERELAAIRTELQRLS